MHKVKYKTHVNNTYNHIYIATIQQRHSELHHNHPNIVAVSFAQTRPAFTVKNMYSLHFQCSWTLKTTDASFESNYQIENQMLFIIHTQKRTEKRASISSICFLRTSPYAQDWTVSFLWEKASVHVHTTLSRRALGLLRVHACMYSMYVNAVSLDSCATDTALDRISVLPISVALPLFITRQRDASMVQS